MSETEINTDSVFIGGKEFIPKESVRCNELVSSCDGLPYVLVRSYAAGIHIGYLKSEKFTESGKVVILLKTKRIWYWTGAASISQLSLEGSKKPNDCKITVEIGSNEIVNVVETIPLTKEAFDNPNTIKTWKI